MKAKPEKVMVSVRFPKALKRQLAQAVKDSGVSQQTIVNRAVQRYLELEASK